MKIKHHLLLTHGILVVLAIAIVLINGLFYQGMKSDARFINKIGEMRAINYRMTQLANQLLLSPDENKKDVSETLLQRIRLYEQRIDEIKIAVETETGIRQHRETFEKLDLIVREWEEKFRILYYEVINKQSFLAVEKLNNGVSEHVLLIHEMVSEYSDFSEDKVVLARLMNGILILLIIFVASFSLFQTKSRVEKPLSILAAEMKKLSLTDDEDILDEIKRKSKNEIIEMTDYFNEMVFDPLTGAYNRRAGMAKLRVMASELGLSGKRICICFLDINGLKVVNDTLGHETGDELIKTVIGVAKEVVREEDMIIRFGGDEFLIVFKNMSEESAESIINRIKERYEMINKTENRAYFLSVSHGMVEYRADLSMNLEKLIREADERMYFNKKEIKENPEYRILRDYND